MSVHKKGHLTRTDTPPIYKVAASGVSYKDKVEVQCDCEDKTVFWVDPSAWRKGRVARCVKCRARRHHGLTEHPLYGKWVRENDMMCDEWKADFLAFHDWSIANGWQAGLSFYPCDDKNALGPGKCQFLTREAYRDQRKAERKALKTKPPKIYTTPERRVGEPFREFSLRWLQCRVWRRFRIQFLKDHPVCESDEGCCNPSDSVHHRIKRSDMDVSEWMLPERCQALCSICHNKLKMDKCRSS